MICDEIVVFNPDDEATFTSKTFLEDFFYMKLFRYVVSHTLKDDEHVNVVIVDQNGKYRGHKDAYVSKTSIPILDSKYTSITDQIINHKFIELFFLVNPFSHTIFEYINEIHIKTTTLVEKITSFIEENKEIYEILPTELIFSYANKTFNIKLLSESNYCCFSFEGENEIQKELLEQLLPLFNSNLNETLSHSPIQKLIILILKISNNVTFDKNDLQYTQKLLTSDKFFSEIQINPSYKENIQATKNNFALEFPCAEYILNTLLDQKVSLITLFDDNVPFYKCIIDFLEYLERRKVFIF